MENNIKSVFSIGEAFSFSWKKFKETWQILVPASIIILIISTIISPGPMEEASTFNGILEFVWFIAQLFIGMGWAYIGIRIVRNEKISWRNFIDPAKYFWKYLGTIILFIIPIFALVLVIGLFFGLFAVISGSIANLAGIGVVGIIVFIATFIAIIWYVVPFMFYQYIVIDQNKGPMKTLKESFRMTKGTRWKLLGFIFILCVFNVLGVIPAMIGLIITIPMSIIMTAFVYEKVHKHANGQSSEFPIVQPKEIPVVSEEVKTPDTPAQ